MDVPLLDLSEYVKDVIPEIVPEVDPSIWKEDEEMKEAFHKLATRDSFTLKDDIELIPLNTRILGDETASPHLVTRKEQRDVTDCAFNISRNNLSKRNFIVTIRGSRHW
jgi:hypothetical protein